MKQIFILFFLLFSFQLFSQSDTSYYKVGDLAPDFMCRDQYGNNLELDKLLKKGPVLLFFYRGYWCPHCRREISDMQDSLDLLVSKGVTVIAVTPESIESIEKTMQKTNASFHIVFDEDHNIMNIFKLSFELKGPKKTIYKLGGINLKSINGEKDDILPVPATYLIGKDRRIKYLFYDVDYTKRARVSDILKHI